MKTTSTYRKTLTIAALLGASMLTIGCSSGQHAGDINSIRMDPSPSMHTLDQRSSDRVNMHARMKDSNLRMISTDIDKMFYVDRPSRLHHGIKP
tara:strand:- start:414192 stop:414473 length:282 start_codon:yes stop_codon:yes gene_type:complete